MILKIIIRSFIKNKFSTFAKLLGLVVGYVIFIFIAEKILHETNYDTFWSDYQSIYRVALNVKYENGEEVKSARNFKGASKLLEIELPSVTSNCNFSKDIVTVFYGDKQKIQNVKFGWTDPSFFTIFDCRIIQSTENVLLQNIHGVSISKSFAHKLFGDQNPLGKEIILNEGWKYIVNTVFEDIPKNSHLQIDILASYQSLNYYMRNFDNANQILIENPDFVFKKSTPYSRNQWRAPAQYRPYGYIKLSENTDINSVNSKVTRLLNKVSLPDNLKKADIQFLFQPISNIHLESKLDYEYKDNGDRRQVIFLYIIIIIVLLVCIINFMNLNTISTIENVKSFKIRMLNGASNLTIFKLMFCESLLFNILALTIAILLGNTLIKSELQLNHISFYILFTLGFITITVSFLAAFMPYISVVKNGVFSILKSEGQKINQKWIGQKLMVTIQFSITIILIICVVGIYKQMAFVMDKELGFKGNKTLFSFTPMSMIKHPDLTTKMKTFKDEVLALSAVNTFSVSSSIPGEDINHSSNLVKNVDSNQSYPLTFNIVNIDNGFVDTYNLKLIAGENLKPQDNWNSNQILLNKTAINKMGFQNSENILGKFISFRKKTYQIIGVIDDYHHISLHQSIKPTIYFQNIRWDKDVGYYSMKISSDNVSNITSQIETIWNSLYPKEKFTPHLSNVNFENQYKNDHNFNRILTATTFLALCISCLGLFSVALFNTNKYTKEIGIRKVNGATIKEIMLMLNKDFVKWVGIAFVIACPVAYYAMSKWLENFAYKTSLSWWVFALAGVFTLVIALLTVSWQSYRAATRNPVEALRDE